LVYGSTYKLKKDNGKTKQNGEKHGSKTIFT